MEFSIRGRTLTWSHSFIQTPSHPKRDSRRRKRCRRTLRHRWWYWVQPYVINYRSQGFNLQQSERSGHKQEQSESRPNALSSLDNCEMREQSLTAPVCMLAPRATAFHWETNGVGMRKSMLHLSNSYHKDSGPSVLLDRSSDDGYNWRKYGQKVVKGSAFFRSYYKCAYPKCEVKKIFERSYTGLITEIVYKGTHDHAKPQPSCHLSGGALMSIQEEKDDTILSVPGHAGLSITIGRVHNFEIYGSPVPSPKQASYDIIDGKVPQLNMTNDEVVDDLNSKRRRTEFGTLDVTPVVKPVHEPRVVVQTISEVDILDDGYRWRKYGQKVVRCNPNPRSYYKCTSAECPVRKHVERASHDLKAVITTYEGKHHHDLPTASRSSNRDIAGPAAGNGNLRIISGVNDAICLDLVVGNRFFEQH